MRTCFSIGLALLLLSGVAGTGTALAEESSDKTRLIYPGFFSREGNDGDMAKASGHNEYIKFYPQNRIIRLYIPFPYAKNVKQDAINSAFNNAAKESTGSAYIRSKFGVMDEQIVAHLDFFRWVDDQVMYDCDKPKPCRVTFEDSSMIVIKPGMVLEHKIRYTRMNTKK